MPIKILMPALSPTMTEGNLAKWLKKEGDVIKAGEVIAEIETDKATMEVEAIDEGVLAKIIVPEGSQAVAVNSAIAVLLEEGEDQSVLENFIEEASSSAQVSNQVNNQSNNQTSQQPTSAPNYSHEEVKESASMPPLSLNRIFASPLAKRLATQQGIDLTNITGSGPHGRIIKADIEDYSATSSVRSKSAEVIRCAQEYELVPNNTIRKIIAKRLLESKQTIPHFYLSIECNVDKLLMLRADINLNFEDKSSKISVNDFIILAASKALQEVKEVNASFEESAIKYYNNVDISIAVATDFGLVTPVIRNANQKNITKISAEMKELAKKAKANRLLPEEFQGGGFTISNLGMFDITNFAAIINPPQSAILAIGASKKTPIVVDEQVKIATIMHVTLSCDHRVVDGVVGAKFLSVFKKYIEHPGLMLL